MHARCVPLFASTRYLALYQNMKRQPRSGGKATQMSAFTQENPCPTCYGWDRTMESTCTHAKYVCPTCNRQQCLWHWPYPMATKEEALPFLKSAEVRTGKPCFVRLVIIGQFRKWKIFTSEEDFDSYLKTRKHQR